MSFAGNEVALLSRSTLSPVGRRIFLTLIFLTGFFDENDSLVSGSGPRRGLGRRPKTSPWSQQSENGKYFIYLDLALTWVEAQDYCIKTFGQGSNLPLVNSKSRNTAAHQAMIRTSDSRCVKRYAGSPREKTAWIGLFRRPGVGGGWLWEDGSLASRMVTSYEPEGEKKVYQWLGYVNWGPSQPNNEDGKQNCAAFGYGRGWTPGQWNDLNCHKKDQVLCEVPGRAYREYWLWKGNNPDDRLEAYALLDSRPKFGVDNANGKRIFPEEEHAGIPGSVVFAIFLGLVTTCCGCWLVTGCKGLTQQDNAIYDTEMTEGSSYRVNRGSILVRASSARRAESVRE